jgi:hypothetical protein
MGNRIFDEICPLYLLGLGSKPVSGSGSGLGAGFVLELQEMNQSCLSLFASKTSNNQKDLGDFHTVFPLALSINSNPYTKPNPQSHQYLQPHPNLNPNNDHRCISSVVFIRALSAIIPAIKESSLHSLFVANFPTNPNPNPSPEETSLYELDIEVSRKSGYDCYDGGSSSISSGSSSSDLSDRSGSNSSSSGASGGSSSGGSNGRGNTENTNTTTDSDRPALSISFIAWVVQAACKGYSSIQIIDKASDPKPNHKLKFQSGLKPRNDPNPNPKLYPKSSNGIKERNDDSLSSDANTVGLELINNAVDLIYRIILASSSGFGVGFGMSEVIDEINRFFNPNINQNNQAIFSGGSGDSGDGNPNPNPNNPNPNPNGDGTGDGDGNSVKDTTFVVDNSDDGSPNPNPYPNPNPNGGGNNDGDGNDGKSVNDTTFIGDGGSGRGGSNYGEAFRFRRIGAAQLLTQLIQRLLSGILTFTLSLTLTSTLTLTLTLTLT